VQINIMLRYLINTALYILPISRFFILRNFCLRMAGVKISKNVSFCGHGWIYGRGNLVIGSNTWISPRVIFHTHENVSIIIGNFCDVGPGVSFITGSHIIGRFNRRAGEGNAQSIFVGNGSWIGANSLILGGVKIGAGAVVAAGSVVIRDVQPNTLVAGVPAKIRKNLL
jgi:maltose O-acetyltransferase